MASLSNGQFKNIPHPDSDPPSRPDSENMLGCSVHGCNADFNHPMTRAWHISQRHPGEYSGASEDMQMVQDIGMERGTNFGLSKRYTFKKGAPKPVRGVDFGPGIG